MSIGTDVVRHKWPSVLVYIFLSACEINALSFIVSGSQPHSNVFRMLMNHDSRIDQRTEKELSFIRFSFFFINMVASWEQYSDYWHHTHMKFRMPRKKIVQVRNNMRVSK